MPSRQNIATEVINNDVMEQITSLFIRPLLECIVSSEADLSSITSKLNFLFSGDERTIITLRPKKYFKMYLDQRVNSMSFFNGMRVDMNRKDLLYLRKDSTNPYIIDLQVVWDAGKKKEQTKWYRLTKTQEALILNRTERVL